MPRRRRLLVGALVALVALPVLLVVIARSQRGRADAPVPVAAGVLRVRNLFTDIYGLRVGDRVAIFDAGIDEEGRALDVLLGGLGATRAEVTDVFLTHGHFDHVAASPRCTNARIHVGAPDVDLLAHRVPTEPAAARWLSRVFPVGPIESNAPYPTGPGPITLPFAPGHDVVALPLPGHTRGSYVLLVDGVLIAGDSLQIDGDHLLLAAPPFSVDVDANRAGVKALAAALAGRPLEAICTGHQGCTPPGRARAMLDALVATL